MASTINSVQTVWLWYVCPHCQLKIAVTFKEQERGLERTKECPRCKKPGWATTNVQEASYTMSDKYGKLPSKDER